MVSRVSLDPTKHKMSQYAKVYTNKSNSKQMTKLFAAEFFYEDLSKEIDSQKSALIIKDGCNDLIYEIEDFSKKYPNQEFTIEYFHKKGNKKLKEVKIQQGAVLETKEFKRKSINSQSNKNPNQNKGSKKINNKKPNTNQKITKKPETKSEKSTKVVTRRQKKV
tara:strand:+ start:41258 stop:41749 length:492 start_codon:yes stop_codon:yes gene_type:complete